MPNANSNGQAKALLAAAVSSVGLAGFGVAQADAGLFLELRTLSATGSGNSISPDGKTVTVPTADGRTIIMGLYARISGTNAVQQVIDFYDDGSELVTVNDDRLQSLSGAFSSAGSLKGDMGGSEAGPNEVYNTAVAPFGGVSANNGILHDIDGDGDLDLGGTGTLEWSLRANGPSASAVDSNDTKGWFQSGPLFGAQSQDLIIDATTMELRIGTIRFNPTAGAGSANIQFLPRQDPRLTALWFEDGIATGKNPANAMFTLGAPVNVSLAGVPEPTAASLLGIAALGLVSRRCSRPGG